MLEKPVPTTLPDELDRFLNALLRMETDAPPVAPTRTQHPNPPAPSTAPKPPR